MMFVKVAAVFLVLATCYAQPVEETKPVAPEPAAPVPAAVSVKPAAFEAGEPSTPPKPDNSDLNTDATSWWHHSWYHHNYPVYHHYRIPHHYHTYHYNW